MLHHHGFARQGMRSLLSFRLGARSFTSPTVQLYQYEICPFCCKVKAFLDWQKLVYQTVEVNPLSKAEIKFSDKYRKVPIAMIDGVQVNDSTEILSLLASKVENKDTLSGAISDPAIASWLAWCDKELAVLLFPNITRSMSESWQAFRYIGEVPTFGIGTKFANQLAGSLAMRLANGKLKKKYNITDERKQLLEKIKVWTDAVGDGPFLNGKELSVADVAVYGVISSIGGLSTHSEIMIASPALEKWFIQVRSTIGKSKRIEDPPVIRRFGPTAEISPFSAA